MSKSLVIVESPAKAKTISKYLGKDFTVEASVGHIKDLPKNKIGVDLSDGSFAPELIVIPGKEKVVDRLKKSLVIPMLSTLITHTVSPVRIMFKQALVCS